MFEVFLEASESVLGVMRLGYFLCSCAWVGSMLLELLVSSGLSWVAEL